jgi:GNAT superfamily N-acetyltransferase
MEDRVLIRALDNSYCQQVIDLILPIQQIEFGVPITIEVQPDLLDIEGSYIRPGGGFWGAVAAGAGPAEGGTGEPSGPGDGLGRGGSAEGGIGEPSGREEAMDGVATTKGEIGEPSGPGDGLVRGESAEGGIIVGSIALMAVGHGAGVIRKMFVRKEFRGKELSIAQRLLDTLVGYCREHGIGDLYLGTVDRMKAAHRFYERNGFRPIRMEALPSYFPRMKTDNLFYHLHL